MKHIFILFSIALCAMSAMARDQNLVMVVDSPYCPSPAEMGPLHLYGLWRAEFEGQSQGALLLFEKHPELTDSVRGGVNRDGVKSMVAGDVDNGEFTLEESQDGQHISATWLGTVVENSCGKEIRGLWNDPLNNVELPFILRKLPGWQ